MLKEREVKTFSLLQLYDRRGKHFELNPCVEDQCCLSSMLETSVNISKFARFNPIQYAPPPPIRFSCVASKQFAVGR